MQPKSFVSLMYVSCVYGNDQDALKCNMTITKNKSHKPFNPQTATPGQIWPQPSFFFDNVFGVSYNETNLREFVTTGIL